MIESVIQFRATTAGQIHEGVIASQGRARRLERRRNLGGVPLLLAAAEGDAADELALEEEEEDQQREAADEPSCHQ